MAPYIGDNSPDLGGYTASAAIAQNRVVMLDSGTTVKQATAGTSTHGVHTLGIATEAYEADQAVGLKGDGVFPAMLNGNSVNIAAGDPLKTTTGGILIKAATTADIVNYEAVEAVTTDGVWALVRRVATTLIP